MLLPAASQLAHLLLPCIKLRLMRALDICYTQAHVAVECSLWRRRGSGMRSGRPRISNRTRTHVMKLSRQLKVRGQRRNPARVSLRGAHQNIARYWSMCTLVSAACTNLLTY